MAVSTQNFGYKKTWQDLFIEEAETTYPIMTDYHIHDFYEVSLILSGNVNVLTPTICSRGTFPRVVLTPIGTPHYVTCERGSLYKRANIVFSEEFMSDTSSEAKNVMTAFGKCGNVIKLEAPQAQELLEVIRKMKADSSIFRKKLLLTYLLSLLADVDNFSAVPKMPPHVTAAMEYIEVHYGEKIIASELAWKLKVGRTTLLTSFKKYTGTTLNSYIVKHRIYRASELLKLGKTESEIAELCGFGDSTNMIRSFKRELGVPPMKYIALIASKKQG